MPAVKPKLILNTVNMADGREINQDMPWLNYDEMLQWVNQEFEGWSSLVITVLPD